MHAMHIPPERADPSRKTRVSPSRGVRWRAAALLVVVVALLQLQSVVAQMKCHNSKKLITDYRLKHAFNGENVIVQ